MAIISELNIDVDVDSVSNNFYVLCEHLDRILKVLLMCGLYRKSFIKFRATQHGYHIKVSIFQELEKIEIILLQALCGSDWKREVFNFIRLKQGRFHNILFEKKYRKGKLVSSESDVKTQSKL